MSETEKDSIEQAVELLLYAPVGLLYEYQNVLPQLVKRGKSQVQIARLIGKMAMDRRSGGASGIDESIERVVGGILGTTAQVLTEVGQAIGLAPPEDVHHNSSRDEQINGDILLVDDEVEQSKPADSGKPQPRRLPIARYDELTAKEIIPLLEDLKPAQRSSVDEYERSNRARKTILAKIERLDG